MKRIVCAIMALLLLAGCTAHEPKPVPTEPFRQGVYEFSFSVDSLSGDQADQWEFVYTYNGEPITNGHQILFPLEIFTFHSIQVEVIEKGAPSNAYSATFPVAICDGGSGKTEVKVIGSDGEEVVFKITCRVTLIGKQ